MDISDFTATKLQDGIKGPNIFEEYGEQVTKTRMKIDKYINILAEYFGSIFQDFESFPRTEIDLVEDNVRLVLGEKTSSFISYELEPGIHTFKDISEALLRILQFEYEGYHNAIDNSIDDITMKSKLSVRPGNIAIRFDEKSFFSTSLGFNHGWE